MKKTAYNVKLRRKDTGEEHTRLVLSDNPEKAGEHAINLARKGFGASMADRMYAQFDILSCVVAPPRS